MPTNMPESLLNLDANCGVFALWMIFQQHGVQMDISELIKISGHENEEGTFTIALAIALKKFGFDVTFYTDEDPNITHNEMLYYEQAYALNIPIQTALSEQEIKTQFDAGKFVIVYYDTLQGEGNQSLLYSMDEHEISFFDSFESMPLNVFKQQRSVEGICRQVIVIDDRDFNIHSIKLS